MTVIRRHLNPAPAGMACTPIFARDGRTSAPTPRENSRTHNRPARPKLVCRPRSVTARALSLTLPHSLHSALKEFFNPLRAGNPRADFFAVYHKESSEFDRDYAGRFDGDLNTALIFVSRLIFDLVTEPNPEVSSLVCSPESVQHSSPVSNQNSNRIRAIT